MWVIATSIFWTSLGVFLFKFQFISINTPRILGRSLYWVGVPLQILVLARKSNFSPTIWLPPLMTVGVLLLGLGLANLSLHLLKHFDQAWSNAYNDSDQRDQTIKIQINSWFSSNLPLPSVVELIRKALPRCRSGQGSFVLAAILGNTGFVGLAIVPAFVNKAYLGWVVLYGVTHNLLGSYGLGVFLASYFGRSQQANHWWIQLRDLLSVPSLWAFAIGLCSHRIQFPVPIESALKSSVLFVISTAFLFIGMQLCQLRGVRSLQSAIVPTILKMLLLPGLAGLAFTFLGLSRDACLTLVLMSGMPTAFANLILAEEYGLDRQLAASSIVLSTVLLPLMIPLWLALFG